MGSAGENNKYSNTFEATDFASPVHHNVPEAPLRAPGALDPLLLGEPRADEPASRRQVDKLPAQRRGRRASERARLSEIGDPRREIVVVVPRIGQRRPKSSFYDAAPLTAARAKRVHVLL